MPQHPETYEEALEDAIEQEKELQAEKKSRKLPAKKSANIPLTSTERARARVLAKLAAAKP